MSEHSEADKALREKIALDGRDMEYKAVSLIVASLTMFTVLLCVGVFN